jgi:multiple sugar transport system permease protein
MSRAAELRERGVRSSRWTTPVAVHLMLGLAALAVAVPLVWAVKSSLGTNAELQATPVQWLPTSLHFENYTDGLVAQPFSTYFLNSFIVAVAVTITTVVASALAGYGFAKFSFPGRSLLFAIVIVSLMIPFQAIMIPLFIQVRSYGWLDSLVGLIIPGAVSGFGIFLMRQFMRGIPDALCEAARIDGANELQVFWRVVLPLARSSLAALAALTFLASWNNFLWPLIVVQSTRTMTVPLGLAQFQGTDLTNYVEIIAVSLVAAIPVVALYVVMQRQIITSFATTGVKG